MGCFGILLLFSACAHIKMLLTTCNSSTWLEYNERVALACIYYYFGGEFRPMHGSTVCTVRSVWLYHEYYLLYYYYYYDYFKCKCTSGLDLTVTPEFSYCRQPIKYHIILYTHAGSTT